MHLAAHDRATERPIREEKHGQQEREEGREDNQIDAAQGHDADVALPESKSPYGFEPFCAYYAVRVREPLSEFLRAGGGAARDFLRRLARVNLVSRLRRPCRVGAPHLESPLCSSHTTLAREPSSHGSPD